MYKLIFRGELLPGYVKVDVINNLAVLLKQPPEQIERLFSGAKDKIIKRVDSSTQADKWEVAFAHAGARLIVVDEAPVTSGAPPSASAASAVLDNLTAQLASRRKKSPRIKRVVLSTVGALAIAGMILFAVQDHLHRWVAADVTQDEKNIIASLASTELLAIARVDVNLIKRFDATLVDNTSLQNLPSTNADLWSSLARAGVDIPRQLTQLYAALYVADKTEQLVLARGDFEPQTLADWIGNTYGIDKRDSDGIWFTPMNQAKCEKGETLLAQFSAGQVMIGSPAAVKRVAARLQSHAAADIDIAQWQESLAGNLVSLAGFSPARWRSEPSGMLQHMLGKLSATMKPVDAIYADVTPDVLAQALAVNLSLNSKDTAFIRDTEQSIQKTLADSKQKFAQDWPEVSALYQRIQVSQSDNALRASVRFDRNIKDELAAVFASMFSFSRANKASLATADVIEEHPVIFASTHATQLKPFAPQNDVTDASFHSLAGPFGVGIESVALENDKLKFRMGVKAYDLPNVGRENSGVVLTITDVQNDKGDSLLSVPTCGADENRAPTAINYSYATSRFDNNQLIAGRALSGSKDIVLPSSLAFSHIARIKGRIDYALPTEVTTSVVNAPFAGKVIDLNGVRVRFMSSSASSLVVEYSGDTQKLLQINALNAAGKPLSDSSAMRSSTFFGSGKKVSIDFKGTIAKVELVVAEMVATQHYEFELTQLAPPANRFFSQTPNPERLTAQDFAQLSKTPPPVITEYPYQTPKTTQNVGPATLAINDLGVSESFGFAASGAVYTYITLPLFNRIGIAQLQLEQFIDKSGQAFSTRVVAPLSFDRVGGMVVNGVYQGDEKTPWLRSDFSLRSSKINKEGVVSVRGKLRFFLPQTVAVESVAFNLGELWSGVKSSLILKRWESGRLVFVIDGALDEVVGLRAFNAKGQLISQPPRYSFTFGEPEIALEISEQPVRFEVEIAKAIKPLEYPFVMNLP